MSVIYFLLSILFYSYFYKRTNDLLCPNGIFLGIWFISCGISCIDYDDFMAPWCAEMYAVTIVSGFSYFIGVLISSKESVHFNIRKPTPLPQSYSVLLYILFLICFSCFLLEWNRSGRPTIFNAENSGYDLKSALGMEAISGIHYGTVYLPYISLAAYYGAINSIRKSQKIPYWIIIGIIISTSLFTKMSRGDLIIIVFGMIFIYSRYYKISVKSIIISSILIGLILIGTTLLRINTDSIVFSVGGGNPYWNVIYGYVATCFANLNDFIIASHNWHISGDGTLSALWTIMGLSNRTEIIITEQLGVFNACTYLYYFYHDFKLLGVIIFPLLLGMIITTIYIKSINSNSLWNLLISNLQKAIWTPFFGNYFFAYLIILFPYVMTLVFISVVSRHSVIRLVKFKYLNM